MCKPGSTDRFESLYRLYYPKVRNWFLSRGFKLQDAEDLAHDTFARAFQGWAKFRGQSSPLTWLLSIAWNVASNHRRGRNAQKRRAIEDSLEEKREEGGLGLAESSQNPDPLRMAIIQESIEAVNQACEALPPRQKQCIKLWAEGYMYKEIAQLLGIKIDTFKSNLHLARQKILQMCPDITADSDPDGEEER